MGTFLKRAVTAPAEFYLPLILQHKKDEKNDKDLIHIPEETPQPTEQSQMIAYHCVILMVDCDQCNVEFSSYTICLRDFFIANTKAKLHWAKTHLKTSRLASADMITGF